MSLTVRPSLHLSRCISTWTKTITVRKLTSPLEKNLLRRHGHEFTLYLLFLPFCQRLQLVSAIQLLTVTKFWAKFDLKNWLWPDHNFTRLSCTLLHILYLHICILCMIINNPDPASLRWIQGVWCPQKGWWSRMRSWVVLSPFIREWSLTPRVYDIWLFKAGNARTNLKLSREEYKTINLVFKS